MNITRKLAVVAFATLASVAGTIAIPFTAGAASASYLTLASPSLNERSAPSTSAAIVASLPYHSTVTIACQTTGSSVNGSTIWDRLGNGDFVSDWYVSTPDVGTFSPGLTVCSSSGPAPRPTAGPARTKGLTTSSDQGDPGQCTWWADSEFHSFSGLWPNFVWSVDNGNAEFWAKNAAHNGWTVTATPEVDSVAVFQPGNNGADSVGHVAWVTAVHGDEITISEMNATAGPGKVDSRTLVPVSAVRFILAP